MIRKDGLIGRMLFMNVLLVLALIFSLTVAGCENTQPSNNLPRPNVSIVGIRFSINPWETFSRLLAEVEAETQEENINIGYTGIVFCEFGYRPMWPYDFHAGIDIDCPIGTPIPAVADGIIVSVGENWNSGKYVVIYHETYDITTFHLHASEIWVSEGEYVTQSQTIALVGSTGSSTGPHLHLAVTPGYSEYYPDNSAFTNPRNIDIINDILPT